ncbi:MAG TPA: hypothetical protein VMU51_22610 [Mycobacteriales bacterium]|jgi:hypothetical protein|nr:hypothetical protein [Mycobacteriales bacterium]
MTISYTRSFHHPDWIDRVDRVQAGGDNGFNGRFHGIEAEFDAISGVVKQADTQLTGHSGQIGVLQQQVAALGGVVNAPVTLGLMPTMSPFNPDAPNSGWSQVYWSTVVVGVANGSYVKVPTANAGAADGVLALTLPEGVTLLNIAVLGQAATPANMKTVLVREQRSTPFTKTTLLTVTGFVSLPVPGSPVFSSDTDLFYLRSTLTGAAASDVLRGFAITYQPAT